MPGEHVRDVLRDLAAHPFRQLIYRWNWKTALLTAAIRGAIFFSTNVTAGLAIASEVLVRDLVFRVPLGGLYGAISQAFSGARPSWAVYLMVMIVIPGIAHAAEFLVHWSGGTPRLSAAITTSIAFSIFSAVFNLFLMRRGALLTGVPGAGLAHDLRRMPGLLLEFVIWIPMWVRHPARDDGQIGVERERPDRAGPNRRDGSCSTPAQSARSPAGEPDDEAL